MSFRIIYSNPDGNAPMPERYEGYDLASAWYDYLPNGIGATITLDGYRLDLYEPPLKFVDLVRQALPVAEELREHAPSTTESARSFLPSIPPDARIYGWTFVDFLTWLPMIVFVADGKRDLISIYTRTLAESEGYPWIIMENRDRAAPVMLPREAVIAEIRNFLAAYLDDLSAAFPFLRDDDMFQDWRRRVDSLV